MKKYVIILISSIFSFSCYSSSVENNNQSSEKDTISKNKSIFISYSIPISNSVKNIYKDMYTESVSMGIFSGSYMTRIVENPKFSSENILKGKTVNIFNDLLKRVEKGQLETTVGNPLSGPVNIWFQEYNHNKLDEFNQSKAFGNVVTIPLHDLETGEIMLDDEGNTTYKDTIELYDVLDFVGFHFWEEWIINYDNLTINKNVLYFAPLFKSYNYETGEMIGTEISFILKNNEFKNGKLFLENNYSSVNIFQPSSIDNEDWFKGNYIESSARFQLTYKMLNRNNTFKFYEPKIPYNKEIDAQDALTIPMSLQLYDENTGEPLLNQSGEYLYQDTVEYYSPNEIQSIGFLEDWYYDGKTMSIKKVVKGFSPEIFTDFDKFLKSYTELKQPIPIYFRKQE